MNRVKPNALPVLLMCVFAGVVVSGFPPGAVGLEGAAPSADALPLPQEADALEMYRVTPVADKYARTEILSAGADILAIGDDHVIVNARPAHIAAVGALGYRVEPFAFRLGFPPGFGGYRDYNGMMADIRRAVAAHPGITRLFSIGASHEGRDLATLKISDAPGIDGDEPAAYFIGLHHAREHITLEMTLAIMRYLTDNYNVDDRVTDIVDNREVFITFNLNPDGGEFDVAGDTFQWWRKNRQPNPGSAYVGTDLNRNYAYMWGVPGGSSPDPGSDVYRGRSPFSAPETAAVRTFVHDHPNIRTSISFHNFSELILWPYGYTYEAVPPDMDPADHARFLEMAEYMASTNGYAPKQASDLYASSGSSDDWMYGEHRILAFTFEMYPRDGDPQAFYPADSCIEEQCARNMEAVLYLCEQAGGPMPAPAPLFMRVRPNSLVPGDGFTLTAGSRTAVNGKCDIYLLCLSPYGVHTIFPDGAIAEGIHASCRGIALPAPFTATVLGNAVVPDIRGNFTFILAATEAGKIPRVGDMNELLRYSSSVLSAYTVAVTVLPPG